ncbi:hypothetical protein NDU88_003413 [Pleurodeles waltl]|uniref:Uncharacterized protein n=1 Tax=Pleurodeles waltl TaxID=8319 RepID=A0AAV7QFM5_PLEWA|nr:hypothetical protein NDU88_003413 [Pleurodeles waltl]
MPRHITGSRHRNARVADRPSALRARQVTAPCLAAVPPCLLIIPLQARSPSGTCGGGCGGCGEALVVRRACEHGDLLCLQTSYRLAILQQIGGSERSFGATPHHIALRGTRIAA